MKHILFDTTFILPLFGFEITTPKNIEPHLRIIFEDGIDGFAINLPNTCLLEAVYLLNKEYRKEKNIGILNRYPTILPTLINNTQIKIIDPLLNPEIVIIANGLKQSGHTDLLDCLIAGSAIYLEAVFVTIDKPLIKRIKSIDKYKSTQCWTWSQLLNEISIKK